MDRQKPVKRKHTHTQTNDRTAEQRRTTIRGKPWERWEWKNDLWAVEHCLTFINRRKNRSAIIWFRMLCVYYKQSPNSCLSKRSERSIISIYRPKVWCPRNFVSVIYVAINCSFERLHWLSAFCWLRPGGNWAFRLSPFFWGAQRHRMNLMKEANLWLLWATVLQNSPPSLFLFLSSMINPIVGYDHGWRIFFCC